MWPPRNDAGASLAQSPSTIMVTPKTPSAARTKLDAAGSLASP